ncbi:hypothetical protein PoB_006475600 [Plakobranchus ocellatus]|uniref:BESS domain-containing protein n=1 Tax=Plakobranchus ocellatus TaxID=259542 RepID=A0AAV4D2L2_9GAST|nr:hypothetical protein PoB_006475600 [Plakobranchus ocellatus]
MRHWLSPRFEVWRQIAARSGPGVKFSRRKVDQKTFLLHQLLLSLAEEERSLEEGESQRNTQPRGRVSLKKMCHNKVSPDPDDRPPSADDAVDVDNLDLGHHRVDLDNVETEEDRAKTVELIRALPCRMAIKRKLLYVLYSTMSSICVSNIFV